MGFGFMDPPPSATLVLPQVLYKVGLDALDEETPFSAKWTLGSVESEEYAFLYPLCTSDDDSVMQCIPGHGHCHAATRLHVI